MTSTRQMIITLFVVAVSCAIILSFVYAFTAPRIAETQAKLTLSGLEEVMSAHKYVEVIPETLWEAFVSLDRRLGIVCRVFPQGYGGPIPITVGLDAQGLITGIRIASAAEGLAETPGLGAKITETDFTDQFRGKCVTDVNLVHDGGEIQAITAATISSRAVSQGVKKGIETYSTYAALVCDPMDVFPQASSFSEIIADTLWYALRDSDTLGIVFVGVTQGYLDRIEFMVGYSKAARITGITVLYSKETDGIGESIRDAEFLERFKEGTPQAISGATVSSQALIDGVSRHIDRFKEYVE